MFDVADAYAEWVANPDSFAGESVIPPGDVAARVALEPDTIFDEDVWQSMLCSVCGGELDDEHLREWLGVTISGIRTWANRLASANASTSEDNDYNLTEIREAIDKHLFLSKIQMSQLDTVLDSSDLSDVAPQISSLLDAECALLSSGLETLVPASASAERTSLALLYLEPAIQLIQREEICQNQKLSNHILKLICLAVKLQHQQASVQSHIVQLLSYYEHTPKIIVQLLQILKEQYNHTSLIENVFREVAMRAGDESGNGASAAESTPQSKTMQKFFQGIASVMPEVIAHQLPAATPLFDSAAPHLRQAGLELAGTVMQYIMSHNSEEGTDARLATLTDILSLVITRVNDLQHFCRSRALQTLTSVAGNRILVPRRPALMAVAAEKMKDRASLVRRSAIKLAKVLLESHPFTNFDNQLAKSWWESRYIKAQEMFTTAAPGTEQAAQLEMMIQYHKDALEFIEQLDGIMSIARSLLQSKTKSDILDAMDLLVVADAFGVESSKGGIQQMVHLVWAKADNDEGDTVCSTAVSTYKDLFMTADPNLSPRDGAINIAHNLIGLTLKATQGEMTSLERLLYLAMEGDMVDPQVITALYRIFQAEQTTRLQRRGSAAILAMLASYDRNIALSGIRTILEVGLTSKDLELAKYSCILARRSVGTQISPGLPVEHELFTAISEALMVPAPGLQWFSFAKEALRAMGALCDSPENLYTSLVRTMTVNAFEYDQQASHSGINKTMDGRREVLFGQLLFAVGEIALNTLVRLESCEQEFKRARRAVEDKKKPALQAESADDDEEQMMAGGGSVEDTFVDALHEIKERELLFSDRALLRPFAKLIPELCRDELSDEHRKSPFIAVAATQTLAKFMCVSSAYCAENLPLLLKLMDNHTNSVIRSNLVVSLADVAVSFNRLVDQHTEFLYARLDDPYPVVQRTCIVALTFLILAGQIKVKGQLVEMAKSVENEDPKIASLATMFFRELATKDNAIYNSFLDILSGLAADTSLPEATMMSILKFLARFIDKDRQIKQLTEKLMVRMSKCETQRQWNACVQVLKALPTKVSDEVKAVIDAGFTAIPGSGVIPEDNEQDNEQQNQENQENEQDLPTKEAEPSTPAPNAESEDRSLDTVVETAMGDLSIVESPPVF